MGPYAEPARPGIHWALVLVGIPIGFVAWVIGSFAVLGPVSFATGPRPTASVLALVVLVLLLLGVDRPHRVAAHSRLWQGFVLGAAIGLVVAGGLCIPLISSLGGL